MSDGNRFYEKPDFWPRLVGLIFLLFFVVSFRAELLLVLRLVVFLVQLFLNRPGNPLSPETPTALIVLGINLLVFLVCYFIMLKWVSFFVLPARDPDEKRQVYERLIDYILKLHGPAVFVKNGELISRKEEVVKNDSIKANFVSLALVDLSSAVVLESRSLPEMLNISGEAGSNGKPRPPLRVLGPGIGFLHSGERIRGCVDLRKQFRMIKGVRGFTSDGIELETNLNVIFTLGQAPQVMTVVDIKGEGLRVLSIDRESKKITGISNEIDEEDAGEIYAYIQGQKRQRTATPASEIPFSNRPPFTVGQERIIAAVIKQPRNAKDGKLEKWTDLPGQVAVSVLLDELSRVSYDHLYSLDRPGPDYYLYDRFKPEIKRKVINLGVMAYQFVQRKDGRTPLVGSRFNPGEYSFWEPAELHNSRPIRDRGIKIIEVGFSDFKSIDGSIPEQRFDNWRSLWQKKVELTNAEYDLEIMRKMNHSRAQAQREIIYNLSQIFKLPGYTQDAMAIRIFEALESAAANPATNRLLPRDTVDMLKNFQKILFTEEREGPSPDDLPPEEAR
jgi:hypothetical protein